MVYNNVSFRKAERIMQGKERETTPHYDKYKE